jgi:hypothetical protein
MSSLTSVRAWCASAGVVVAILAGAMLAPAGAAGASVVNGTFENGTLAGWKVETSNASGDWVAYTGTVAPISGLSIAPPPEGLFAATSDETGPGLHILYQDVALEPFFSHTLTMAVYYHSSAAIAVPEPDTLSPSAFPNQQYRIDVMKPTAPIDSVNPADILTTVFRTRVGDPETLAPTTMTANLTPFAGQTVRLRFAEVDNSFFFNGSVDAVSIASVPPSNVISLGAPKLNKKKGTATIPVTVPGAGLLTVADAHPTTAGRVHARATAKKPYKARIKPVSLTTAAAGTQSITLRPSKAGRKILKQKGKLKVNVAFSFTPVGGTTATQTRKIVLKQKRPPKKQNHG